MASIITIKSFSALLFKQIQLKRLSKTDKRDAAKAFATDLMRYKLSTLDENSKASFNMKPLTYRSEMIL